MNFTSASLLLCVTFNLFVNWDYRAGCAAKKFHVTRVGFRAPVLQIQSQKTFVLPVTQSYRATNVPLAVPPSKRRIIMSDNNPSPASARIVGGTTIVLMGVLLLALLVLLGAEVTKLNTGVVNAAVPVKLWPQWELSVELHLTLVVLVAGMLGACVHVATSFSDYVGNGQYKPNWQWWYLLRPMIGGAVALIFYVLVRGGILSLASGDVNALPNAFGMAAMAALAGMFSKQATDKLDDVFDTLFNTDKDDARQDGLRKPIITSFDPAEMHVSETPQPLKVLGTSFDNGTVQVNGTPRETTVGGGTLLTTVLTVADLKAPGDLSVRVANADGTLSEPKTLKVLERRTTPGAADDRAPAGGQAPQDAAAAQGANQADGAAQPPAAAAAENKLAQQANGEAAPAGDHKPAQPAAEPVEEGAG